jgi:hypothetical protein
MIFVFELNFHNLKKLKFVVDQVAHYNIVTIRIEFFEFHITIIRNLVFSSYTGVLHIPPPI